MSGCPILENRTSRHNKNDDAPPLYTCLFHSGTSSRFPCGVNASLNACIHSTLAWLALASASDTSSRRDNIRHSASSAICTDWSNSELNSWMEPLDSPFTRPGTTITASATEARGESDLEVTAITRTPSFLAASASYTVRRVLPEPEMASNTSPSRMDGQMVSPIM